MRRILDFLEQLSCNNNRSWFEQNKALYQDAHNYFVEWNEELLKRLSIIEPQMQKLTPKDCIWRIYRDVRFSPDKRPYKEWFGSFPAIKGGKKVTAEDITYISNLVNVCLLGVCGVQTKNCYKP